MDEESLYNICSVVAVQLYLFCITVYNIFLSRNAIV